MQNIHIHREHPGVIHFDGDPMSAGTDIDVQLIQKGLNMIVNTQQASRHCVWAGCFRII